MPRLGIALFVLFHAAVPVYGVFALGAGPFWLLGSLLFAGAVVYGMFNHRSRGALWLFGLLSGLHVFLNLSLGTSWYMQGTGFNDAFFFHFDIETFKIAASAYSGAFFSVLAYQVAAFFTPLLLASRVPGPAPNRYATATLWLAVVVLNYPLISLSGYFLAGGQAASDVIPELPAALSDALEDGSAASAHDSGGIEQPNPDKAQDSRSLKNIVLIYAEGLEQLYMDRETFGDVVPRLRALAAQSRQFTNVYQVNGATTTIAGIVASQCGFPLLVSTHLASNSTMTAFDKPFENERCLADILQDRGYATVYLGGAPLAFAGKGNFLRTHGYDRVLGREELMPRLEDPSYGMGWGLHDDSLFGLALEELAALEEGEKPYLLTVLTIGTHHPDGHVAASCAPLPDSDDSMLQAIYCSDQLISGFIERVRQMTDPDETLIVVFSDHLAMRNTLWDTLQEHKDRRRLTWFVLDGGEPVVDDQPAVHFDMAPTVLELAGLENVPKIGLGRSLLAADVQLAEQDVVEYETQGLPDLGSSGSVLESGFQIDYARNVISVDDWSAQASVNGWPFTSGLFMLILDNEGRVLDTLFSTDFSRVIRELSGRLVVGISIHEEDSDYDDQFFFGRLSEDFSQMRVAPLAGDVSVPAAAMEFLAQ